MKKKNQLKNWSDLVIVFVVVVVGILLLVISQLGVIVDTAVHWKSVAPAQRGVIDGPPNIAVRVARTSAEKGGYFVCIKLAGGRGASGSPTFWNNPKTSSFFTNTKSQFVLVVLDGVLGPLRLALDTWQRPFISGVQKVTPKARLRALRGRNV